MIKFILTEDAEKFLVHLRLKKFTEEGFIRKAFDFKGEISDEFVDSYDEAFKDDLEYNLDLELIYSENFTDLRVRITKHDEEKFEGKEYIYVPPIYLKILKKEVFKYLIDCDLCYE